MHAAIDEEGPARLVGALIVKESKSQNTHTCHTHTNKQPKTWSCSDRNRNSWEGRGVNIKYEQRRNFSSSSRTVRGVSSRKSLAKRPDVWDRRTGKEEGTSKRPSQQPVLGPVLRSGGWRGLRKGFMRRPAELALFICLQLGKWPLASSGARGLGAAFHGRAPPSLLGVFSLPGSRLLA
jgi:hypothetical protein